MKDMYKRNNYQTLKEQLWTCEAVLLRQNSSWFKITNDSKANLNQLLLYQNNYQILIKHKRNNYYIFIKQLSTWICSNPTKQPLNQNDHWPKVNLSQSLLYGNKTSSRVAFKPPLILSARFLMCNAPKNSNWDQLQ